MLTGASRIRCSSASVVELCFGATSEVLPEGRPATSSKKLLAHAVVIDVHEIHLGEVLGNCDPPRREPCRSGIGSARHRRHQRGGACRRSRRRTGRWPGSARRCSPAAGPLRTSSRPSSSGKVVAFIRTPDTTQLCGHVDMLALSAPPHVVQRADRVHGSLDRRVSEQLVRRGSHWWTVLIAVQPREARHRCDHEVGTFVAGIGTGLTEWGDRGDDERRVALQQVLVPDLQLGEVAGGGTDSTTTSAPSTSSSSRSRAPWSWRSSSRDRLPRFSNHHVRFCSGSRSSVANRKRDLPGSPPGGSILTTSAPRSASSFPAQPAPISCEIEHPETATARSQPTAPPSSLARTTRRLYWSADSRASGDVTRATSTCDAIDDDH